MKKLVIPVPLLMGLFVGFTTASGGSEWYINLNKPFFTPPDYLFGPVWTTLYLLMGVALYLVLKSNSPLKKNAVTLFSVQLFLNFIWSYIFFTFHNIHTALADLILLDVAVVLTAIQFGKINKTAAILFAPYMLWLSVATALNLAIVILN